MSFTRSLLRHSLFTGAPFVSPLRRSCARGFSKSLLRGTSYDSDGKTTATVLNQELGSNIMIDSYSVNGFRLNNGVFIVGPLAIFPKSVLGWNIKDDYEICEDALSLFTLIEPKLDILIIGYGGSRFDRSNLDKELVAIRSRLKLNIELLPTDRAIATYNFLASESRWVAAALVPPQVVKLTDADMGAINKRQEPAGPV